MSVTQTQAQQRSNSNSTANKAGPPVNTLALVKKGTVDLVESRVKEYMNRGELNLPANYSPSNALKSAWLILQTTVDREKRPVLAVCTQTSVVNSLLDMVIQGLNPVKKQCYFIAYGSQLVCQRSYFGTMAVAKLVDETIQDIVAEVVYEGDVFKYKLDRGRKVITEHEQQLENVNGKKIKAAYAMVVDHNGEIRHTEIMTFDQIKQAWKQSQIHPVNEDGQVKAGTTHDKFTAEMAMKTVINKICKPIINSSDDANLFEASRRAEDIASEAQAQEEIRANANRIVIDMIPEDEPAIVDDDTMGTSAEDQEETPDPGPGQPHSIGGVQQQAALFSQEIGPGF